ncbi:MAG: cyclic nucleotide-binding domain-containing protein [Deltaproteobacteria bacterium]|nr:cyclic nucleotide-binding domain-containing protein [Deltaproteobacteria bacterium]
MAGKYKQSALYEEYSSESLNEIFRERGKEVSAKLGEILFSQGDTGSSFFIIQKGTVELQFDGYTRRLLRAGNFFGEIGILGDLPRTATAKCLTSCKLLEVSAEELLQTFEEHPEIKEMIVSKYGSRLMHSQTRSHPDMSAVSDSAYEEIVSTLSPRTLKKDELLFEQGAAGDEIFLILQGKLSLVKDKKQIQILNPGEIFGEIGTLRRIPRTASVIALEATNLLFCHRDQLKPLMNKFPSFENYLYGLAAERLELNKK